jgi:hypothetical protein
MNEIIFSYIVPNFLLFGGIYVLAKMVEKAAWHIIVNYEELFEQKYFR